MSTLHSVQSFGFYLIAVIIGLTIGALFGTQSSVNGYLGGQVEHPLQASLISFSLGTLLLLVLTIAAGQFPPQFIHSAWQMPWWAWTGGAIGVMVVSSSLFFVPRIGSLVWFSTIITGQMAAAVALDHFGLLGNPPIPASNSRIFGLALLLIGVFVIVQGRKPEIGVASPRSQSAAESVQSGENEVE